ncbi:hypothetical protein AB6A40_010552 [Gnathostoma spinigerum]|uniref:Uncharacterized protein n=1 Tax=Gnathostoma spinigerum TaxID=75299 RepID=A0ABD6EV69_9BILA
MIRLLIFPFIFGFSQTFGDTTKCKTHFIGVIDGKVGQIKMEEKTCKNVNAECVALAYCRVRLADGKYEYGVASYCNGEAPSGIPYEFNYVCSRIPPYSHGFGCRRESRSSTDTGYEISFTQCCQGCPDGNACNNVTISTDNPKCQQISSTTFAPLPTTKMTTKTTKGAYRFDTISAVFTVLSAFLLS